MCEHVQGSSSPPPVASSFLPFPLDRLYRARRPRGQSVWHIARSSTSLGFPRNERPLPHPSQEKTRARARANEIAIGVAGLTRFPLSFCSSDSRSCCTPLLTGVCTCVHEWSDPFGTTECFGNERSLQGRRARVFEGDPRQRRDSACCAVRRVAVDAGVEHRLRSRN